MRAQVHTSSLVIDCDPGCDDALAILLIAKARRYDSVDILTVAGNVPVEQTTANAVRMVSLLRSELPSTKVYPGSARSMAGEAPSTTSVHGRDGLGDAPNNLLRGRNLLTEPKRTEIEGDQDAVAYLISLSRQGEPFDLLCTGPLTNLAMALNLMTNGGRERFWKNCKQIVVMGGSVGEQGNISPSAEFNFFFDPLAVQTVLDHLKQTGGNPRLKLVPLNATEHVAVSLKGQRKNATRAARFLFYALQQYGLFHSLRCSPPPERCFYGKRVEKFDQEQEKEYIKSQIGGSSGLGKLHRFCYLHDPLAAWVILQADNQPEGCWQSSRILVETTEGPGRGRVVNCSPKQERAPLGTPDLGTEVSWLKLEDRDTKKTTELFRSSFLTRLGELLHLRKF